MEESNKHESVWPLIDWQICAGVIDAIDFEEHLAGRVCYGGLKITNDSDVAAIVYDFPPLDENDRHWILCRFWMPEETVLKRSKSEGVNFEKWIRKGYITVTPGSVVDYKLIIAQIGEDNKKFKIQEFAYDRYSNAGIGHILRVGMDIPVVQMGQGFISLSAPMKELKRLVRGHGILHGDNPVLNWMADNLVTSIDDAGNVKPDAMKSKGNIDGITALVMAIARTMEETVPAESKGFSELIQGELKQFGARIEVLELNPGDVVILSIPGSLSDVAYKSISNSFQEIFPHNKVIILENDLHIDGILRPQKAANEPG